MAPIKNDRRLTLSRLKEVLDYDPDIGLFVWRITLSPRALIGSVAGAIRKRGYRLIRIDGGQYKTSRLAWFYVHGEWPAGYLDHVNGVRCDDRLSNLREATKMDNAANMKGWGKIGIKGVYRKRGKYTAMIMRDGKQNYLGTYKNLEDAATARKTAALKLHGTFASELR